MLNPFPDLLSFALLAPFLIRIALGGYYLLASACWLKKLYFKKQEEPLHLENNPETKSPERRYTIKNHIITWILFFASLSVLAGLFTQIGALALAAVSLYFLFTKKGKRRKYGVLTAIALSLLFSGAGFFAFDVPL